MDHKVSLCVALRKVGGNGRRLSRSCSSLIVAHPACFKCPMLGIFGLDDLITTYYTWALPLSENINYSLHYAWFIHWHVQLCVQGIQQDMHTWKLENLHTWELDKSRCYRACLWISPGMERYKLYILIGYTAAPPEGGKVFSCWVTFWILVEPVQRKRKICSYGAVVFFGIWSSAHLSCFRNHESSRQSLNVSNHAVLFT